MTFDLHQILTCKSKFRRDLAARDIMEKLIMLDALRERALTLRGDRFPTAHAESSTVVREETTPYRSTQD